MPTVATEWRFRHAQKSPRMVSRKTPFSNCATTSKFHNQQLALLNSVCALSFCVFLFPSFLSLLHVGLPSSTPGTTVAESHIPFRSHHHLGVKTHFTIDVRRRAGTSSSSSVSPPELLSVASGSWARESRVSFVPKTERAHAASFAASGDTRLVSSSSTAGVGTACCALRGVTQGLSTSMSSPDASSTEGRGLGCSASGGVEHNGLPKDADDQPLHATGGSQKSSC